MSGLFNCVVDSMMLCKLPTVAILSDSQDVVPVRKRDTRQEKQDLCSKRPQMNVTPSPLGVCMTAACVKMIFFALLEVKLQATALNTLQPLLWCKYLLYIC